MCLLIFAKINSTELTLKKILDFSKWGKVPNISNPKIRWEKRFVQFERSEP